MRGAEAQRCAPGDEISNVATEGFANFLIDERISGLPYQGARLPAPRDLFLVLAPCGNRPPEETPLCRRERGAALTLFADLFIDPGYSAHDGRVYGGHGGGKLIEGWTV